MRRVAWVGVMLSLVGCAERYSIPPTQIGAFNDDIGAKSDRGVEARTLVKLETVDGRIVEVKPPVVVYITTEDHQEHTFCSPLRATFSGGVVEIKHNCGRSERIYHMDIQKVEVEEW